MVLIAFGSRLLVLVRLIGREKQRMERLRLHEESYRDEWEARQSRFSLGRGVRSKADH